jgi:hypothetical protein
MLCFTTGMRKETIFWRFANYLAQLFSRPT